MFERGTLFDMIVPCEERDRRWIHFCLALKRYIDTVNRLALSPNQIAEAAARCDDALAKVEALKADIERHCVEHGCDPKLPEAVTIAISALPRCT